MGSTSIGWSREYAAPGVGVPGVGQDPENMALEMRVSLSPSVGL